MMSRSISLKKNFSFTLIGNVVYSFSQWINLMIIAKLGTSEMLGQYALGLAIVTPVMMFTNLQLRQAQITDVKDTYQFGNYAGLRLISIAAYWLIIIVILSVTHYSGIGQLIIVLVAMIKSIESVSDLLQGKWQKNERMDLVSISLSAKGVLNCIFFCSMLWVSRSIIYSLIAQSVIWIIFLFVYEIPNVRKFTGIRPIFKLKEMVALFRVSFPLGVMLLMITLNSNMPRYFIGHFMGESKLGQFTAITYFIVVGTTIVNALGQSAAPRLSRLYSENNIVDFKKLLKRITLIGVVVGLSGIMVALILGKQIVTLMYTSEYAQELSLIVMIMIVAFVNYVSSFLGYGITAMRSFNIQPFIGASNVLVSFVFSIVLIPSYGLSGAAYSLMIASIVEFFLKSIYLSNKLRKLDYYINYQKIEG